MGIPVNGQRKKKVSRSEAFELRVVATWDKIIPTYTTCLLPQVLAQSILQRATSISELEMKRASELCARFDRPLWEFPKIRGTLFWGPSNKDPTI